jgi:threonine dehydrogenase-like Zn-dependent dehydrogenase
VREFAAGDRVAILSQHAFAEYDLADVNSAVKVPAELRNLPAPGEPLACALNVFRRSDIQPGQAVAVVGSGFLGTLLIGLAAAHGADVIAVSRRHFALEMAERYGARHLCSAEDPEDVLQTVRTLTNGGGCDRVIEATGHQQPLTLAGELVRVRGKLVIAGYHQDGLREVNLQSWNWRGIDVVNAHERDPAIYREGMQLAFEEIAARRLDPLPLYTHSFPLSELGQALEATRSRPDGFMKALVLRDP